MAAVYLSAVVAALTCREDSLKRDDVPILLPAPGVPTTGERIAFFAVMALLTAISLWPLWSYRFLPMQDYPQHLFLSHVVATYHDPAFNWQEFYTVDLGLRPYMLWYLAMAILEQFCTVDVAGRMLFSLYILLIGVLVLSARRLAGEGKLPWGALLLYPFAFNQMYYFGFPNYIISVPLVLLAVLDLDHLIAPSPARLARHGLYCLLLFLNHPYSVLVYIALAAASVAASPGKKCEWPRLMPAAAMALCFALWYLFQHKTSTALMSPPWPVGWWPIGQTVLFYLLPFLGMRVTGGVDWLAVGLWAAVALVWWRAWPERKGDDAFRRLLFIYGATVIGFLVLPSWLGYYSYFNSRLAPISYFALSILLCRVPLRLKGGLIISALLVMLLVLSVKTQRGMIAETETLLPVLASMRANALVLPLVADGSSDLLDPLFFYQHHAHEPYYYNLLVGGGASPTLFPNAMMPVQYRPWLRLPLPSCVAAFSWEKHGAFYDYILVRKGPPELSRTLSMKCRLAARSGYWDLYENRMGRRSLPGLPD